MNRELVAKALDRIINHQNNFDMHIWYMIPLSKLPNTYIHMDYDDIFTTMPDQELLDCGTTMCLAGWAVFCVNEGKTLRNLGKRHIFDTAVDLYGISERVGNRLFYQQDWPYKYRQMTEYDGAVAILTRALEEDSFDFVLDGEIE